MDLGAWCLEAVSPPIRIVLSSKATREVTKGWGAREVSVLAVVVLVVAYFIAFRFQYIHVEGYRVMRVDHLTGTTCEVGLNTLTNQNACDPPSEEQKQSFAISLARDDATSRGITQGEATAYLWKAEDAFAAATAVNAARSDDDASPIPAMENVDEDAFSDVYLVCYCDAKDEGWRWEVHIPTRQALYVNSDKVLSQRYGLK
jgi:hypothetical protein